MASQQEIGGAPSAEDMIENVPYDEVRIGQSASLTRVLGSTDIELFATVSGDTNPTHFDQTLGNGGGSAHRVIGHGLWTASLVSAVLGTKLPGPGTIYLGQSLRFQEPVEIGDTVTARVTVRQKRDDKRIIVLECNCYNQDGDVVVNGTAEVIGPTDKVRRQRMVLPRVEVIRHDGYQELMGKCAGLEPLPVAITHPCDRTSITSAAEAAEAGLIRPVLVGPSAKIKEAAEKAGVDIAPFQIVDTEHSHESAAKAVALARSGEVEALMKGSLHTDELMGAVVRRSGGLRTARRVSHVFVMIVPSFPRPLLITDAAINIAPSLKEKADICQNAIDLAHAMEIERPKVAILSAVEMIDPNIASTLEAAALCKMAERGQISGGVVDGPMTLEYAISREVAMTKGLTSEVAGKADILLVPDLESGNMVAKQLTFLANADGAGIVLGAQVPIILTSRADTVRTKLASCALTVLKAHAARRTRAAA